MLNRKRIVQQIATEPIFIFYSFPFNFLLLLWLIHTRKKAATRRQGLLQGITFKVATGHTSKAGRQIQHLTVVMKWYTLGWKYRSTGAIGLHHVALLPADPPADRYDADRGRQGPFVFQWAWLGRVLSGESFAIVATAFS